jgi:hypothetical protein
MGLLNPEVNHPPKPDTVVPDFDVDAAQRASNAQALHQMMLWLRTQLDPSAIGGETGKSMKTHLTVSQVFRIYDPDDRGLREVLYCDTSGAPITAFVLDVSGTARSVAYITEGW